MGYGRITRLLNLEGSISLHVCLHVSESTSITYLKIFFLSNYCLRSRMIKVGSALKRANYSCDFKKSYFPRRDGYIKLFCTCSAWPYWFLRWVFFLTIVEKVAPRFPESITANLNSVLFQEMLWSNKGFFQMQSRLPKIYTHSMPWYLLWLCHGNFLDFISFIINRAKSKEEAKQVQGTSLLSYFTDYPYESPRQWHIITKQYL